MIGRSGPQLRGSIQGSAKTALTLAMLIAATAAGASVLTKSYSFTSDSVMFAKDTVADTVFDVITMSTCGADDRLVGAPQLPQRAVSFLIPSNAKMDSVVATATAETLSGSYNPVPIQPLQDTSTAFFPPSTYLYEAGYPRDFVDGATDGSMSNYRMVSFNLRPVRLLPNGQLVKAQQLTVYVYYTLSAGFSGVAQTRRSRFCQEELSHTVAAIVENPEHTTDFGVSVPIDTPESLLVVSPGPSPSGNYVDCVIVTLTQDSSEYERYAEFLTQRGIVTTVRTLAWIDGQYQGADDAACVRAFIKDANIQWGTLFVILAGWPTGLNTGLPTRLIPSGTNEGVQGWEGLATTDVYFADLKGSWDDNNNGVYMEPPVNELSALCFTDGLHGCGVDPRDNYVMVTNDGGTDWSPSSWPTGFGYDVADMDFADVGHGACAGWKPMPGTKYSQTTVWTTADGGSHWYERTGSEIEGRLNGIYFVNAYNGWAVGWNHYCSGIILHTTNGGTDWTQVQSPLTHGGLYDVKFSASGQLGWITSHWTSHGNIIRTTNAGASWDTVHLPGVYPNPRSVSFADSNFGWVTGSTQDAGCAVWATTDGGASWQAPTHPGTGEVGADIVAKCTNGTSYDVWVATPTHIYHGDQSGNWTEQYSSIDTILRHIQFLDDALHGWASGPFQGYLYTSDGGDTWQHEIPGFFWKDSSALCMMPDVFVGRLPSLPGDGSAQTVIDKLIAYQATPELTHLQKIKLCAGAGTHGSSDLRGLNALTDSSWLQNLEITKIWDLSSGGQYPFHREYVLAGLNDGSQFITHDYHGGDLYWQTGDDVNDHSDRIRGWTFRHPDSVHNGNMTGIALTNGCNALFMMGADTSNIGRGFLTCQTGGAVAYQGCSRPSSFEMVGPKLPYYDFLREVYEWNVTRLGLAHVAAITTARGTGRDRAYWNILGDPLMDIWTDIPKGFAVTHPPYIPPQAVSFTVTVLDTLAQLPVDGALVCLCMHDSATGEYPLYHIGKTAPDGTATFFIAPRVTGEILVTVTKHNYLPHTSTCHIGLHSDDPNATYPNWGRKFVREPNTDNFHVAFTSGDTTFYSRSTDGGASWSAAEPIGAGTSPAIALNAAIGGGEPVPWVAYLTSGGSIMRAIRDVPGSPGIWNKAVVFQGGPGASAGAPSLAVPAISSSQFPEAFVTYPVCLGTQPTNHFVYFNTFTPYSVSPPETVDAAGPTTCYGASVAVSPLSIVHVGWIRGQSVIYRQRLNSVWSAQVPISSPSLWPVTEPASNPSMEAYGDSVFCVWRGPNDNGVFPGDIWRRSRSLNWLPQLWADAANQSKTPDRESDFPVMTTSFATVWQEKVALDNYPDIWGKFLAEPYARPFFESPLPSTYPHADGYWVPGTATFKCHFAWTEMLDQFLPLYEVKFGSRDYTTTLRKGFGPEPHYSYEPSLYYAAELGQAKQSPYCVSRGGYTKFEGWNVDTSATTLRYQLPYMDPRQVYKLCAVIYHAGKRSWSANVRCDSGQWTSVKTEPGVPDTVWLKVPKRLYRQDARIVLELARATGDYVSLAELKLYQVEDRSRDEEGTQSAGTSSAFVTRLRSCTPNPFAKSTSVNYELGHAGPVALTVHDVSGRLVRRLESGPRPVGRHVVRWNGTDARGRVVPAGVYFVRLSADGQVSTGRLTLVR